MVTANVVFGMELRLPCDVWGPLDKVKSTSDYAADLVERLRDIHHYAHQHLKVASDRMKTCYNHMAYSARFQKGDQVWLFYPTQTRGKPLKLQSLWEGQYNVTN
jgi:hypothetical protein